MTRHFYGFSLSVLLLFLTGSLVGQTGGISGLQFVCQGVCYEYSVEEMPGSTLPNWSVLNQDGNPVPFTVSESGFQIEVCFSLPGTYTISTGINGPFLTVTAGNFTEIELEVVSPSGCAEKVGDCEEFCVGTRVTWQILGVLPEFITWSFSGDGSVISESTAGITIQFNEQPGVFFISYSGNIGDRQCFFEGGFCVQTIERPTASFVSFPEAENDTIRICQNQNIDFQNTSGAPTIQWFGTSGASGSGSFFSTSFPDAGVFEIVQTVSSGCDCSDAKSIIVEVLPGDGANIYCVASVCVGDTIIYSSDPSCEPYFWQIEGSASIISGGEEDDDYIELVWNSGPEGIVELSNACSSSCPIPTRERINILGGALDITGPLRVCLGESYSYFAPLFNGAVYSWGVSSGGFLVSNQGTNQVSVEFFSFSPPPYITVLIEDCTRGCMSQDTLWLQQALPYTMEGSRLICIEETGTWESSSSGSSVPSTWTVLDQLGNVIFSEATPASEFQWTPSTTGIFTIISTPVSGDYCTDEARSIVSVSGNLPELTEIIGPFTVCPDVAYEYTAVITGGVNGIYLEWDIRKGSDIEKLYGLTVRNAWEDRTDQFIRVNIVDAVSGCVRQGDWQAIDILEQLNLQLEEEVCPFTESIILLQDDEVRDISWMVSPASDGVLLDFPTEASARFKWHGPGTAEVTATYCGLSLSQTITISPELLPVVNFPPSLCSGDIGFLTTDPGFESYEWYQNGVLVCNSSNECTGGPGAYLLVVSNAEGCTGRVRFIIEEITHPNLVIRPDGPTGICTGGSVALYSNIPAIPGFEYNWYLNGVLTANGIGPYIATDFGEYQLEAVHVSTGCVFPSNIIVVCDFCPGDGSELFICPGSGGGIGGGDICDSALGAIQAVFTRLSGCNEYQFVSNNPQVIPESVVWLFYDGPELRTLSGNPIEYSFGSIGRQLVFVFADMITASGDTVSLCREILQPETIIGLDFSAVVNCAYDSVTFMPTIDLDAGVAITGFEWNFGDPTSGANNTSTLENAAHLFTSPGAYMVTLQLYTSETCITQIQKEVIIPELPDPAFTAADTICTGQSVVAFPIESHPFLEWYFDNTNSPDKIHDVFSPGIFSYEPAGVYEIKLVVENIDGCINEAIRPITVLSFSGLPEIVSDPAFPLCEGDTAALSLNSGIHQYIWSDGSTDAELFVSSNGSYSVTLSDENGCSYVPDPFDALFYPLPDARVFGQIPGGVSFVQGDTLTACFGAPVWIQAQGTIQDRTFLWTNGATGSILKFDDSDYPFLTPGLYSFGVSVANSLTGCFATSDLIYVRIYPSPTDAVIVSDQSPPLCSNQDIRLFIQNAEAGLSYTWSNGSVGEEIITTQAGIYSVSVSNSFGCIASSNKITINPSPDVSFAPAGCLTACEELLLCLPLPQGYTLTQWLQDGEEITLPSDPNQILITETGAYTGVITDEKGCQAETSPITIEVYEQTSNISGFVFLDLDQDGNFMPPDSLIEGVWIYLWQDGVLLDSIQTNADGGYTFESLSEGSYLVIIDGSNLPEEWIIEVDSIAQMILPCTDDLELNPFVYILCEEEVQDISIVLCFGDFIEVDGVVYESDTTFTITRMIASCVLEERYEISVLPEPTTGSFQLIGCLGNILEYGGEIFLSDTMFLEVTQTNLGCDSLIMVSLVFEDQLSREEEVSICSGDTILLYGQEFSEAFEGEILVQGAGMDCDTLVMLTVDLLPVWSVSASAQASCPNEPTGAVSLTFSGIDPADIQSVTINGVERVSALEYGNLPPGFIDLVLEDNRGCTETISLEILEISPLVVEVPTDTISCEVPEGLLRVIVLSGEVEPITFRWSDGSIGDSLLVSQPGLYQVQIANACDEVSATGRVVPSEEGGRVRYYVPNAFTPNNDEVNDFFRPYFQEGLIFLTYQFEVYDRWGNRMFETDDPESGWDGIFLDELADQAAFVWKFYALVQHCGDTKIVKDHGDVMLLKL